MFSNISELGAYLQGKKSVGRLIIGIDGFGGSGKSTFAEKLARYLPGSKIVSVDSFYEPVDATDAKKLEFNWDRFEREILVAAQQSVDIEYKRFDWKADSYVENGNIGKDDPIIVEGVYCTQKRFAHFYGFKIWIEVSEAERLRRGMERDGEGKRYEWENIWLPYTRKYMEENNPHAVADLVIDGARSLPEEEGIVLFKN